MKKIKFIICLALIAMSSFAYASEKTDIITNSFTKLNISSGFKVKIIQGDSCSVSITIDDEYKNYLRVKTTSSGELQLSVNIPWHIKRNLHSGKKAHYSAIITMSKLEQLKLRDAAEVEMCGFFTVDKFVGNISDASSLQNFNIEGVNEYSDIELILSDAATAKVKIDAYQCSINARDATSILAEANTQFMEIITNSSSQINLIGKTEKLMSTSSGASEIKADVFFARDAYINAKQASSINISILESISKLDISGAARAIINSKGTVIVGCTP